ncbi:MAG: PfkB family carbohydrate kinase [Actinomycetaceae bacterium]|nr:PfkB family carbohydrate kinase [Actinomycetaceae bacterium]MDY6083571.1 PfkB family carbohydrate kinase [Actinomycetaceae bacterium]
MERGKQQVIITGTPNPSFDRTAQLRHQLEVGGVNRITHLSTQPGGKGVNVSTAVAHAGIRTLALFPDSTDRAYTHMVEALGVACDPSSAPATPRINTALIGGGVTTKVNESGPVYRPTDVRDFEQKLLDALSAAMADTREGMNIDDKGVDDMDVDHSPASDPVDPAHSSRPAHGSEPVHRRHGDVSVMVGGSLGPGFPVDEYVRLCEIAHARGVWIGVDTADEPLAELSANLERARPDFMKPNAEELGQIVGVDGRILEESATRGDLGGVVRAARALRGRGVPEVMVTLGGAGALLSTADGTWYAPPVEVQVLSTVGAGDSSVAGYLIARAAGAGAAERLRFAAAYGTAAVGLPGTTIPKPEDVHPEAVRVRRLPDDDL